MFHDRVVAELRPGFNVLDMGSGRRPILPCVDRPSDITYVALDIDADEIAKAGESAYDDVVIADIGDHQPELDEGFDVVISFQVLEHVRSLDTAFLNVRHYLRPGGVFLVYFSGKFSVYALLNQVLPHRISRFLLRKLLRRRDPSAYFPAYYNKCWYGALARLLADWDQVNIVPTYRGASYFAWSRSLQRCYLVVEDWLMRHEYRNLAGYYFVSARKPPGGVTGGGG